MRYELYIPQKGALRGGLTHNSEASAEELYREIPFVEGGVPKLLWAKVRGNAFPPTEKF
jgi:hypothetical protein